MEDKISIVIPCYNAGKYIKRCLKSIINQTYNNLEIMVINDGSTDNSENIINSFLIDERIRYIKIENSGVFTARNIGIKEATGNFIGFVDADDYIEPEMYEKLYKKIIESDADVAVCNYNLVYEDDSMDPEFCYAHMSEGTVNIYDNVYSYWANNCAAVHPNNYAWSRLYKTDVILRSGVVFDNYGHGEDTLFNFKLLPHLKKAVFLSDGLYNYFQNKKSEVHTAANKKDLAKAYSVTFQALADYYNENGFDEFLTILPLHAYTRLRSVFFYSRLAGKSDEEIIGNLMTSWKDKDIYRYLTK